MFLPDVRLQLAAVTLAEELNFGRAAERLRITQPALSKQINELEARLGHTVFSRGQKKLEVTEAGQVCVRGCRDSLATLEKAVRMTRATQDEALPVVTIGHGPYVDPRLLSALLAIHLPLFPSLRLRIESMFSQDLIHGVLSAELGLAIIEDPLHNPLLTQVSLSTLPLCGLFSSEHPAARKRSVLIDDFRDVAHLHPSWSFGLTIKLRDSRALDAQRYARPAPTLGSRKSEEATKCLTVGGQSTNRPSLRTPHSEITINMVDRHRSELDILLGKPKHEPLYPLGIASHRRGRQTTCTA